MTSLVIWLAATVVALAAVVWSGAARRRSLHYKLIVVMLVCLGIAVWRAEAHGATLIFEGLAATLHTIHMVSVALTFLSLPVIVITGIRLASATGGAAAAFRSGHRKLAYLFVVLVLVTAALGTAMTAFATPA